MCVAITVNVGTMSQEIGTWGDIKKRNNMKFMKLIDRINKAANEYNKTKDEKYKKEWYKLVKEYARLYA
jgi:hypothetical protein